jgi:methionyl aminopeptidase
MTPEQMRHIQSLFGGDRWQHMTIKTPAEIAAMGETGAICAHVLDALTPHVQPGVTIAEIDRLAHDLIVERYGAEIVRLAVKSSGTGLAPTDAIAASYGLNDIVANAPASERMLRPGDLFGVDVSARKNGWSGDTARRWLVGNEASPLVTSLYAVSQEVMWRAIGMIGPGVTLDAISAAAVHFAEERGFNVIDTFPAVGHGIGREHNDGWFIPWRVGGLNEGRMLEVGMTFSVEIYLTPGSGEIAFLDNDVASLVTVDGAPASYWEHIVAVTEDGCDVLDLRSDEHPGWAHEVSGAWRL